MFCSTQARPGSEEKIRVMESRYANAQPLFHKDDATVLPELRDNGHGGPVATMPKGKPAFEQMPEVSGTDYDYDLDHED